MAEHAWPELASHETMLMAEWAVQEHERARHDEVEERIRWLVAHRLEHVATSADGWDWLFRDPRDGRLWELTYPQGSLHGAGPRRLAVVDPPTALARYGVL